MEWESSQTKVTIQSPPKLTRVVELDSSKFLFSKVEKQQTGIESVRVDSSEEKQQPNAGFSLPALAGEVADAQKLQVLELSKRHAVFVELQKENLNVQQKIELVKLDISSVVRKVCLTEEEAIVYKRKCQEEAKNIGTLVELNKRVGSQIENENQQLEKDISAYDKYVNKMESHRLLVEEYESSRETGKQIANIDGEIKQLFEQVRCLRDGQDQDVVGISEEYEILQTEISHLKGRKMSLEQEIEQRKLQMKSEIQRQSQLKKDIHLFQKRNHAQLTRLQRQVQEASGRNRHWNEEACKLESSIAQIRAKIEE